MSAMYIKKLTLEGYKRILLSDIKSLTITMDNPYQVILGTNGSGKSSLLRELSPLPGDPKDYLKGGRKEIHIEHHDIQYILSSTYNGAKHHHSFLQGGEEKNDGGTITVQKELVKQAFGINEEMHNLVTGKLKLTNMSPSKRREMITLMSDTDLTYAMGVYKKLATITRDNQGTVKHLKNRIARETDKLRSIETHDDLEGSVKKLQEELTVLMEHRRPDLPPHQDVGRRLQATLDEAARLAEKILTHPYREGDVHYGSLEALSEDVQEKRGELKSKQDLLSHHAKQHQELESVVGSLSENGVGNLSELTDKAEKLKTRISGIRQKIGEFQFEGDLTDLESDAQSIKIQLVDVLSSLPDNGERQFSKSKLEVVETRLTQLRSEGDANRSKQRRADKEIDHILSTKENTCPKCSYIWRDGVSEGDVEKLKVVSGQYDERAATAEKAYKEAYVLREAIQNYAHQFGRLRTLAHSYPKARNLFDWLMDDDRIYHNPSQYTTVIDRWLNDLYLGAELSRQEKELRMVEETVTKAKMLSDTNADHIGDSLAGLHKQIQATSDEVRLAKDDLTKLERRATHATRAENWGRELDQLYVKIEQDYQLMQECLKSDTLAGLIREHQSDLAIKSQKLNEKSSMEGIIRDLERSLVDVDQTHETHKLLCKALSPTDGVIAEQMTAFINCLTEQMNEILEQLYSYPLKILPCGIESNELDYKFPLVAGNDQVHAYDVKDGSEGQQEIVDFAFKLVASLYLGFNDYPLYVDEVGQNQDETHLANVMSYIKLLIDANRHNQLFMISHHAAGHGSFTNADYLVLHGANISTPQKHNGHVEMA